MVGFGGAISVLLDVDTSTFVHAGEFAVALWLVEVNWRLYRSHFLARNLAFVGLIVGFALMAGSIGLMFEFASLLTSVGFVVIPCLIVWQLYLGIGLLRTRVAIQTVASPSPPVAMASASSAPGHGGEV